MRGAVASVERHVLRGRGVASWIVVAVLGLSAGTTMALVAGGRRAATSYDRLIAWSDGDDANFFGIQVDCEGACGSEQADNYLTLGASLPAVESSERSLLVGYGVVGPNGEQYVGVSLEPIAIGLNETGDRTAMNLKVLEGRLFSRSAPDEALIGFDVAERFNLSVGDRLGVIVSYDDMSTEEVWITGIVAYPGGFPSFSGPVDPILILSPAFVDGHPELVDWSNGSLAVKLRDGPQALDEFRSEVSEAGIPVEFVGSVNEQAAGPRQLVRFDAGVLWLLAVVVGIGSLVVIAQILRRAAIAATPELKTLQALGMRRSEFAAAATHNGLRTGVAGVLVASVIAVVCSPLFPVGISRTAEPHPGIAVDFLVLGIGAVTILLLTTAFTCAATLLATRRTGEMRERSYALASIARRLPPAPASGMRLALAPANAGPSSMLRVGLLGLGSILAILVTVTTLAASLDKAIADPLLTGGTWDGALIFEDADARATAGTALANDERVETFALGGWWSLLVNGREVFTQFLDPRADIDIATDRGRAPRGPTEIALGEAEMDALGVDIGDTVEVELPEGSSQEATVVGRAVLASSRYYTLRQGEGAAVTTEFLSRIGGDDLVVSYIVRFRDRSAISVAVQEVANDLEANFAFSRPDRAGVRSLRDVRTTINAVLAVLGVLAIAALLHRLIVTSRSQRRQVAVLRAVGLTGGQVLWAGATTGLVVSALAALVANPVGIVAGVVAWRAIADYLGVIPVSIVPAVVLVVLLTALIATGIAVGVAVVERVRHRRLGSLLRAE